MLAKASLETLKNGLKLVLVPDDHVESVCFGIFVASGSRHEAPALAGISHFIEHMLFKGTATRSALEISQSIEGRGGNFNAYTSEVGALVGLAVIFGFKAIDHKKMDKLINEGVGLMGYVAFVMLVAAGFASVMKATGGIDTLVNTIAPYMASSKILATILMLFVGLFITMGIGTSFGTIPILAVLYVPICVKLGFSIPSIIIVLAAAAALGDAGSPASDTTLGPTAGLNADGQHNHIWDTCIPTFLHYNIPLIVMAILAVAILG